MPASEKTWRDMKLMHTIFGVSGLLLLISTLWMFGEDHLREWKVYQRSLRSIDRQVAQWRLIEQSDVAELRRDELQQQLLQVQSRLPDEELINAFKEEVRRDAQERSEQPPDLGAIDSSYQALKASVDQIGQVPSLAQDVPTTTRLVAAEAGDAATGDGTSAADGAEPQSAEAPPAPTAQQRAAMARAAQRRADLLRKLDLVLRKARNREDVLLTQRKFATADLGVAQADRGLAIDRGILQEPGGEQRLAAMEQRIQELADSVHDLTSRYEKAQKHRQSLQGYIEQIRQQEDDIRKELDEANVEVDRLAEAIEANSSTYFISSPPFLGKRWLELPVLDAFNSPLKIDNLWSEGLTIPYGSFGEVQRFDRCTTCHRAIDKTLPGSAVDPAFPQQHVVEVVITAPSEPPAGADGAPKERTLENVFGFELAHRGLVHRDDVTIQHVAPRSPAALAEPQGVPGDSPDSGLGLRAGDIITHVGDDKVLSNSKLQDLLLGDIQWGETYRLRIQRGLPHPFATHPRLDLFLGSLSPHPLQMFGCTICHEGQGSGTAFKWASHTPNSLEDRADWHEEHGWFNNHHWIYPMFPQRFVESGCLRCHHQVVELRPSARFPEGPAPKLMAGYDLIRQNGCFGCHEINGYKSADERIGPDLRLEPNYYAVAAQIAADPGLEQLDPNVRQWAQDLIRRPEKDTVRHRLMEAVTADAQSDQPKLSDRSHKLASALTDVATPGELRKIGPSLRHVAQKLGPTFLYDWILHPQHFRPDTRMPRFFGNHLHLGAEEKEMVGRFEAVEVLGIIRYLLDRSQPIELQTLSPTIAASETEAMIERGKVLFETRGCLACHRHADFPQGQADFGPDLTRIADKFASPDSPGGQAWLFNWLKDPSSYHPRTHMPDTKLAPIQQADGTWTDPAADIAAYLLSRRSDWEPVEGVEEALQMLSDEPWRSPEWLQTALKDLAFQHLRKAFLEEDARRYLEEGIPEAMGDRLPGAERQLVGEMTTAKLLAYVGQKAISKYGCYGCHDVPGFEDAKPIGTALADWGRKDPAKLAFDHVLPYLERGHGGEGSAAANPFTAEPVTDEAYFQRAIAEHDRMGFLWQKLKEPRSYDFEKYGADPTTYNDRLRMPQFSFTAAEREAVMTFVLGLVAEPPAEKFVYQPDARQQALIAGSKVLDSFNCGGCHILEAETWTLEFSPEDFGPQPINASSEYPFLKSHFTSDAIAASAEPDPVTGRLTAVVRGMPALDGETGQPIMFDEYGDLVEPGMEVDPSTLEHLFHIWEPVLLGGQVYEPGILPLQVPARLIRSVRPAVGGDLTRLLIPRVIELEKQVNPQAQGTEAMGWLPPQLTGEGRKVQPDWLHNFLLDPYPIRPATFLRMPKFNLSSEDAARVVDYFAARDQAEYPYQFDDRTRGDHLAEEAAAYQAELAEVPEAERPPGPTRLDHAMNIVVDANYCVKCHLVGDFEPAGSDRAKGPNLADVHRRLQPDFVRQWIAKPTRTLHYTPMPVNIPYNADAEHLGGVSQQLYHGTSVEQLDALVDLLTNFPRYVAEQAKIAPLVQQAQARSGTPAPGSSP